MPPVFETAGNRSSGAGTRSGFGRAVSRILSAPLRVERTICLCSRYPESVSLSRNLERAAPGFPIWPCTRWGFPCLRACAWSGGLLPHLFTLTPPSLPRARRFDFLWHCPSNPDKLSGSARVYLCFATVIDCRYRVTRHRALWCSDFPPPARAGSGSPPFQNQFYYKVTGDRWQVTRSPGSVPILILFLIIILIIAG